MYLDYRYASGLPFINADKIAVTGVSYGGYIATLMLAERHTDLLACGVAVSPVVDWRFYGMYYIIHKYILDFFWDFPFERKHVASITSVGKMIFCLRQWIF